MTASAITWSRRPPMPLGEIAIVCHASWRKEMEGDQLPDEMLKDGFVVGFLDHPSLLGRPRIFGARTPTTNRLVTGRAAQGVMTMLQNNRSEQAIAILQALTQGDGNDRVR